MRLKDRVEIEADVSRNDYTYIGWAVLHYLVRCGCKGWRRIAAPFWALGMGDSAPEPVIGNAVRAALNRWRESGENWTVRQLAEAILSDPELAEFLREHAYDLTRIEAVRGYLKYAEYAGPSLGQAMLRLKNIRYIVLIYLQLQMDRGADVGDDAKEPAVSAAILDTIKADQGSGRRLFPDVGDMLNNIGEALRDAKLALRRELRRLVKDPCPAPPEYLAPLSPLERVFPKQLPHQWVLDCDYTFEENMEGCDVEFPGGVEALPGLKYLRRADEHAWFLCLTGEQRQREIGIRVLHLKSVDWLVGAGLLRKPDSIGAAQRSWPFLDSSNGMVPFDRWLRKHLRRSLGSQHLEEWVS